MRHILVVEGVAPARLQAGGLPVPEIAPPVRVQDFIEGDGIQRHEDIHRPRVQIALELPHLGRPKLLRPANRRQRFDAFEAAQRLQPVLEMRLRRVPLKKGTRTPRAAIEHLELVVRQAEQQDVFQTE